MSRQATSTRGVAFSASISLLVNLYLVNCQFANNNGIFCPVLRFPYSEALKSALTTTQIPCAFLPALSHLAAPLHAWCSE